MNPKEMGSFRGIYFQLRCIVLYSPYGTAMAHFSRKNFWARFSRRSGKKSNHKNPYSLYRSIHSIHSVGGTKIEVGTKIKKFGIVINAEINIAVYYFSA